MTEKETTVNGLTYDQFVAQQEQFTTPATAREVAALAFGLGGDIIEIDAEGHERARHSREGTDNAR